MEASGREPKGRGRLQRADLREHRVAHALGRQRDADVVLGEARGRLRVGARGAAPREQPSARLARHQDSVLRVRGARRLRIALAPGRPSSRRAVHDAHVLGGEELEPERAEAPRVDQVASVCGGGAGRALACSSAAAMRRSRRRSLWARTASRGAAATCGSGRRTRAAAARPPPLCCSGGSSRQWLRRKAWAAPKGRSLPHPWVRSTHRPGRSRTKPSGGASNLHHRRRPGRRGGVGRQHSSARALHDPV